MQSNQLRPPDRLAKRRNRVALGGIFVGMLVVVVAILFWPSRHKKKTTTQNSEPATELVIAPAVQVAAASPAAPATPVIPSMPALDPAPVIDEIQVEKPEVCSGEDNLITIRAHTVNGTNEFLHYVIDGAMGASVPVRLSLDEQGEVVGQHFVRVFGRTNTEVTVPLPKYKVKDCQPARIVMVEQRLRANSNSDFDFYARVVTLPPREAEKRGAIDPFNPVAYTWNFGDGATDKTAAALASHSYEGRAQDTLYSYYTVGVEVRDAKGVKLTGRTTVPLINPAFEAFARKGVVQLLVALEPRFPELDSEGRVVEHVRLWHTRPENVTIESAMQVDYFESGAGQRQPQAIDPAALLGTTTIPAGKNGIVTTVVLDTEAKPGIFSITYQLSGKSADGHPAMGSFSVMKPPARPTRDNSDPVVDSKKEAKILAAREILHQDVVTDEDLWRLEREGKFADLATAPNQPNTTLPASAPPAMPSPGHVTTGPPVPTSVTAPAGANVTQRQTSPSGK
jgi:hypothetical protein